MRNIIYIIALLSSIAQADTFEATFNTGQSVPIVLENLATGAPEIAKSYADLTFYYKKGVDGTWTALTLIANNCTAMTSGQVCEESAANAPGSYHIYVASTIVDTKGKLFYIVKCSGCKSYWGQVSVKASDSSTDSDNITAIKSDTEDFGGASYAITASTTTSVTSVALGAAWDSLTDRILAFPSASENPNQGTCSYEGVMVTITSESPANQFNWTGALGGAPETTCVVVVY